MRLPSRWLAAGMLGLTLAVPSSAASGEEVRVSGLPGPQAEPTIAIDPSSGDILLAGSNSFSEGTMRFYSSTDGGLEWTADTIVPKPSSRSATCAADPGVAIDLRGRQYYSFVRSTPCATGPPHLYVAGRQNADSRWRKPVLVASLGARALLDDKPAIAVDASPGSRHAGRIYVAWSRLFRGGVLAIVVSHSDDGGLRWSKPVRVSREGREVTYASVAVARNGTVYVAWDDASNFSVKIARSADGGASFGRERIVASFAIVSIPHCRSGIVIPAQRFTCSRANPTVTVDRSTGRYAGRVYVSYAGNAFYGNQGIFVSAFASSLRPLAGAFRLSKGVRIVPPRSRKRVDRFWPQAAVDSSTGALWVCFYDTLGDSARKQATFSCTASRDGGATWSRLVRAASVPSDETQPGADPREYGDYQGLAAANGVAHPIWTDTRDLATLSEEIYTTRLTLADVTRSG